MATFPEHEHPPYGPRRDEYMPVIDRGRAVAANSSIAFVGLARDLGGKVDRAADTIELLGSAFGDWRAHVVENDSVDDTRDRLVRWAARSGGKVELALYSFGDRKWPSVRDGRRGDQLARYRNIGRDWVEAAAASVDYVAVLDLDLACVSGEGLLHTIGLGDWDVVGSNGLQPTRAGFSQYDAWAWRDAGRDHPHHHTEINPRIYARGLPPIPVRSCFGGFAVYRTPAFLAGRYGGGDCEHVVFHRSLIRAGFGRIFCNPSQIVYYDR